MSIKMLNHTTLRRFISKVFIILTASVILGACSSKPSEITWYQLNDDSVDESNSSLAYKEQMNYVQLSKIAVPDYLKQSKLVMRTAPHKMHFAASHLWVQTPEKEIRAALLADLNRQNSPFWFVNFEPVINRNINHQLIVEVTRFYPTENSQVVLEGYWTLQSKGDNAYNQFHFTADLQADGYAHAVAKQRSLITLLSKEITAQIRGK